MNTFFVSIKEKLKTLFITRLKKTKKSFLRNQKQQCENLFIKLKKLTEKVLRNERNELKSFCKRKAETENTFSKLKAKNRKYILRKGIKQQE